MFAPRVYGIFGPEIFLAFPTMIIEWLVLDLVLIGKSKISLWSVIKIHLISYPLTAIAGVFILYFAEIIPLCIEDCYYQGLFKKNSHKHKNMPSPSRIATATLIANLTTFLIGVWLGLTMVSTMNEARDLMKADSAAYNQIKNARTASQTYFEQFPEGVVTLEVLEEYGFKPSEDVEIVVESGKKETLSICASHIRGSKIYRIDSEGSIDEQEMEDQ
ncbi:hypothetical protein [Desulfonema magnum]|uniref:Uncharacterized protein n=1 Tax=Desulfonema magnum TaxID=45655 RepID=A0A975GTI7_9BACT|nr:hypothetical protein [Desulfonema magnum]QTA93165.1 Uncharacterized protein dnm_092620 [Desulfonema magnum]